MPAAPDPQQAIEKYRLHAEGYDASARRTQALRRRAIAMLGLAPGETVVDVACGTGLSLPQLAADVGPSGRVIGIEVSPDMIGRARLRAAAEGLANVELVAAAVEDADLGVCFDAALFHYTHDVLQSPRALERLFSFARPGARVVLAGVKHPPLWLYPLRLYRLLKARPYVTTFAGLDRPWRLAERYLDGLRVQPVLLGTNYLARAVVRG
jgi:demethylmenaquinone methyltransferase/2-methoxy-6-polyprenyl-1,4-benzoquinol methylase